ncbi:C40 family peptidase [Nocardioides pocheonensis]|uniref:NlpC/P60 family protein n=1 Tax=Nocardioides pocheonensis TaxID=661485 RepID=A0A3N0GK47_9ACTN|nr:C40 family peptidase [Nocardioides pocheonensis]RNM12498.1 NlpC/P60 family protein [Nocardioides pocheonensis]
MNRHTARAALTALLLTVAVACGSAPSAAPSPTHTAAGSGTTPSAPAATAVAPPARQAALTAGGSAWVSVSVARLWQSPGSPWPVDAPALAAPVRFRAWLGAMSLSQRRALDLRSDTEALLGDRVVVVRLRPHWAKVVVPSQPSQKDPRGYPGWVPRRQITATPPRAAAQLATVTSRTAWVRTDDSAARRVVEVSFGTNLPVVEQVPGYVRVTMPRGSVRRLPTAAVVVHDRNQPAIAPSRAGVVRTAKSFLGLQYLWGGLSGFGLDCSGLTWLSHRVHGITTPRDALPQSQHGRVVTTRQPGDLLFYAAHGLVHHVSMYVGDGLMIHAPRTGQPVQIVSFSAPPLRAEYSGARSYLD